MSVSNHLGSIQEDKSLSDSERQHFMLRTIMGDEDYVYFNLVMDDIFGLYGFSNLPPSYTYKQRVKALRKQAKAIVAQSKK